MDARGIQYLSTLSMHGGLSPEVILHSGYLCEATNSHSFRLFMGQLGNFPTPCCGYRPDVGSCHWMSRFAMSVHCDQISHLAQNTLLGSSPLWDSLRGSVSGNQVRVLSPI